MQKFRLWLIVFASIMIIFQLFQIDFKNPSWTNNSGNYPVILSMICVIVAMLISNGYEKTRKMINDFYKCKSGFGN